MQNYIKTILSAFQTWTQKKIKESTADWNENDSSKSSYIKNRTHWVEKKPVVKERTVSGFAYMNNNLYCVVNPFSINPVVDEVYTVIWDGASYDVKMMDFGDLGCLGNVNYVDMMTGGNIPFALIFAGDLFLVTESTAESHTISISSDVVHKLDKKYLDLPDNVATLDDLYSYTKKEIDSPKDYIMLNDISDGLKYKIQIKDGNIVSTFAGSLDDFEYTTNSDGTYTITGWKQMYFGEPSTIMVIPDDSNIIL